MSEGDRVQASRSPGRRLWGLNSGAEAFETSTTLGQRLLFCASVIKSAESRMKVSFPYLPEEEKKLERLNI